MPLSPDSLIVLGGSPEVFRTICVCIYVFGRAFTVLVERVVACSMFVSRLVRLGRAPKICNMSTDGHDLSVQQRA